MAAQVSQGLLMAELGGEFVKAHEAAKNIVVTPGGDLPGGIRGVAQLRACEIKKIAKGKNDEGKLMFYAYGVVVTPKEHEGIRVAGKRTMITEPIFNTPTRKRKTIKDHIDEVYKHLKLLGVPVQALQPSQIENAMKQLMDPKKPVFFEFRTWQPPKQTEGEYKDKESMVMHFWDGRTDYKAEAAVMQNQTKDNLPDIDAPLPEGPHDNNGHSESATPATSSSGSHEPPTVAVATSAEEFDDGGDLTTLASRADKEQDLIAVNRLTEMALSLGISQDTVNTIDSWALLVELIRKSTSNNGTHKEPESNEVAISVGDHFNFRPLDPVKKVKGEPVTVELAAINEANGTVDLRQLANRKVWYKNIDPNELEPIA